EPELRAAAGDGPAERAQNPAEQIPTGERLAERLHRRAEALDTTEEVRERPVALDPRGQRQHQRREGARPVVVGAGIDDAAHVPERVVAREVLTALPREADAALVVHRAEAIAADVADPPRVDRVVEARLQPRHAPAARVVRALAVDVDVDVAAARAPGTDGLR